MLEAIKICGISTEDAARAVVEGGATHMGFIFFEPSPRHVELSVAEYLARQVAGRVAKVAVSVDANDTYLDEIVKAVEPDMLQLHGSESPGRIEELSARYRLPIMKAIPIAEASDLEKAKPYTGIADRLLFDAKAPKGARLPGGNGVPFDWRLVAQFSGQQKTMLSGGLDRQNSREAIALSNARAIDVSSGVETAPGVKDVGMIRAFLSDLSPLLVGDQLKGNSGE